MKEVRPWWRYKASDAAHARYERFRARDSWKPLPERLPETLKRAVMLMDAKKYGEAENTVADFLERSPKHGVALAMLIRIHGKKGEIGLSEHLFNEAIHAGIECKELYGAMVGAYASCNDFDGAKRIIADAEAVGMGDVNNYLQFMTGLYSERRYAEIETFYRTAIPPKYKAKPSISIKYADALRKMGRYGEAIGIATFARDMRGTLSDKTMADIIIAYSELGRGNPGKAYELLYKVYEKISGREDCGVAFRFFPRLLCGMVFACSAGGIQQPDSTIAQWRRLLEAIRDEGRGKSEDVRNALTCLPRIPAPPAQQAL